MKTSRVGHPVILPGTYTLQWGKKKTKEKGGKSKASQGQNKYIKLFAKIVFLWAFIPPINNNAEKQTLIKNLTRA